MSSAEETTVAIVIPCYGQSVYLPAAIESALVQTRVADEIIVVDDGGDEDLLPMVSKRAGVRLIRQENRGLAAARNFGLARARSDKIIFLDADDELLPDAIRLGLECFRDHPDAAFVYGAFEEDSTDGRSVRFTRMKDRLDLIRCNWVAMIATVMFDRAKLLASGGFDETLAMSEDWDAYLRLTRRHHFASHDLPVAYYRKHDQSMSADVPALRRWTDEVRNRERLRGLDRNELRAWREGAQVWDFYYGPSDEPSVLRRAHRKLSRILLGA